MRCSGRVQLDVVWMAGPPTPALRPG